MREAATLFRLFVGLVALTAVTLPALVRLQQAQDAAECQRRRAALRALAKGAPVARRAETFVCPQGEVPYLFAPGSDGETVVSCPNGHGQRPIPLHQWVAAP